MRKVILLLLSVLAISVQAEEKVFEIRNIRGLNTVDGDFAIKPNESRFDFNLDHSTVGAIKKRLGYDSVSVVFGMDSIIAIYGAYYSDGTQQLFVVTDSNGTGYGAIYVTPKGSANLDSLTKIQDYWSVFGFPSFAMFGDDVYIVNGYSRGIIYSNGITRDYPPKAPGEPTIVPLNDSGGVNGELRYVFYVGDTTSGSESVVIDTTIDSTCYNYSIWLGWSISKNCDAPDSVVVDTTIDSTISATALYQSVVSDKIIVKNGKVLITGFQFPNTDSVNTSYPNGTRVTVARTFANSGRLTPDTKIYYVGSFIVTSPDSAKRYVFVDSLSDNQIDSLYGSLDVAIDVTRDGRDSLGAVSYRYGSPRFIAQDTVGGDTSSYINYTTATDTSDAFGIYHGMPEQRDTLGYAYTCTFIDTVTGIESDTGRSLFIWLDTNNRSGTKPYYNTISLPRLTADDSGLVINLYRSPIKQITYDSSYWEYLFDIQNVSDFVNNIEEIKRIVERDKIKNVNDKYYKYIYNLTPDTIVANEFYLLAQLTSTDSLYTDSLRQDSVSTKRLYYKASPPDLLDNIFSSFGRLYGVKGSRLYRSGLLNSLIDTLQTWGQMDFQTFNESDGDIGTIAYPTRTSIRFFKNNGSFNVYDDFSKTEISNTIGCIAPQSHAVGIGGHYYLSDAGVIYETEGQQLERTFNSTLASAKLNNFDNYDITEKAVANAFYIDRKYMLCLGDTTYVYDERSGDWSTWNMTFSSATKYGAESNVNFIPGDTMYFIKAGDSVLYRYGSSETDNGATIQIGWQSPPLFIDNLEEQITSIGLWCKSSDSDDSLLIQVYDEEDNSNTNFWFNTLTQRYYEKAVQSDLGKYLYIKLGTLSNTALQTTVIDGFDLYYIQNGRTKKE